MKTTNNNKNETIVNKSKFITFLYKVNNIDEINNYLNLIKKEHKKATHYCFAYIIDNVKRFSDDNEPSGTAGMPILNVLENNNFNYVLCVVVRYFGGIKLGTGGLVRAYTKSVTNCLKTTTINEIKESCKLELLFNYDQSKTIDFLLINEIILNKEFNELIKYEVIIDKNNYNDLINKLDAICIKINIIDLLK